MKNIKFEIIGGNYPQTFFVLNNETKKMVCLFEDDIKSVEMYETEAHTKIYTIYTKRSGIIYTTQIFQCKFNKEGNSVGFFEAV